MMRERSGRKVEIHIVKQLQIYVTCRNNVILRYCRENVLFNYP